MQTRPLPLHGLLHQASPHRIAQGIAQHGGQGVAIGVRTQGLKGSVQIDRPEHCSVTSSGAIQARPITWVVFGIGGMGGT